MLNAMPHHFTTTLTALLHIDIPVVSAPMAGVAGAGLAVAVSRAGGLGTIGIGSTATAEWAAAATAEAAAAGVPFGAGFMGWALDRDAAAFEAALAARPTLVSVSFADPIGDLAPWIARAHEAGAIVAVQAGTAAEAVAAERLGADLVVARGSEAGGHGRAEVATLPLLQQVLDSVTVPVLAAGGIAGPRGLAAILAAGAAGAWVGTAFAGCIESTSSPNARRAMATATGADTCYTSVFDVAQRIDWPAGFGGRALANDFTRTWAGRTGRLRDSLEAAMLTGGSQITADMAAARAAGNVAIAPVYCGEGVGQIRVDVPAAEILADFARAADLLSAAVTR